MIKSNTKTKIMNRIDHTKRQSPSHFTTEDQAVCPSWCRAPFILCIEYCCLSALGCHLCGECWLSVDTSHCFCQLCKLTYAYTHIPCWTTYLFYIFKCLKLCTLCNTCKASVSPGVVKRVCNAVVYNIVVLLPFLQSIRSRMQRVCKCHGMSGSCSIRVCWRKLPPFRQVGDVLSARYEGASHVKMVDKKRRRMKKLRAVSRDYKQPNKTDLVFLEESPDYCERNETWVWFLSSVTDYESHFRQGIFWLIE